MLTCGWYWIYAGCVLMFLELVVPGFVLFFFGMAAATVGAMRLGLGEVFSPTWQLAVFSACSVLYIVLLRRWLKSVFVGDKVDGDSPTVGACVGRFGKVTAAVSPGAPGRVMIGDAEWDAMADATIAVGAPVRVVAQSNLTLTVSAV